MVSGLTAQSPSRGGRLRSTVLDTTARGGDGRRRGWGGQPEYEGRQDFHGWIMSFGENSFFQV